MLCLETKISGIFVPDTLYVFSVEFLGSGKYARWRNVPCVLNNEKFCLPAPKHCEPGPVQGVPRSLPNVVLRHHGHWEHSAPAETCTAQLLRASHGLERAQS